MPSISSVELSKLNALIRRIKNKPVNLNKVLSHVDDLHIAAHHFLDYEVRKLLSAQPIGSNQKSAEHSLKTALAALENTRKYFREPSGSRYSQAKLDLARALVSIYESASGEPFGISSSSTPMGPDYMTPSERYLYASLKLVDRYTTINGMRELYRAACRAQRSTFRKKRASKAPAGE